MPDGTIKGNDTAWYFILLGDEIYLHTWAIARMKQEHVGRKGRESNGETACGILAFAMNSACEENRRRKQHRFKHGTVFENVYEVGSS
jgi:hypothetical protein